MTSGFVVCFCCFRANSIIVQNKIFICRFCGYKWIHEGVAE